MGYTLTVKMTCDVALSENCQREFWAETSRPIHLNKLWHGEWKYWRSRDAYICPACQKAVNNQEQQQPQASKEPL